MTEVTQNPPGAEPRKRAISPIALWALVLVVAGGVFAGVFAWAGGTTGVKTLIDSALGTGGNAAAVKPAGSRVTSGTMPGGSVPTTGAPNSQTGTPTVSPATTTTVQPAAVAPVTATLPASAKTRLYVEQVGSQTSILRLVNGEVSALSFGTPTVAGAAASVPVAVRYTDGTSVGGSLTLRKYSSLWYFYAISAGASATRVATPATIDSNVVAVLSRQQASAANQTLLVQGLLQRGFTGADVVSTSKGSGTATVDVILRGGSMNSKRARFVCISRTGGSTTYWFIASFEIR